MFKADRSHLHHQLLRLGFKHYETVAILYALQATILVVAWWLRYESDVTLILAYAAYCVMVFGAIVVARATGYRIRGGGNGSHIERRNVWLRQLGWYHLHTAKVLGAGAGGLLLLFSLPDLVPDEPVRAYSLPLAAVLTVCALFYRRAPEMVTRIVVYGATVVVFHGLLLASAAGTAWTTGLDVLLVVLVALLVLAIRVTRRSVFHLDTQDFLVVFVVIAVPFLPFNTLDDQLVAHYALRGIALMYVCEYVVTKGNGARVLLGVAAIGSLWITGLVSLA